MEPVIVRISAHGRLLAEQVVGWIDVSPTGGQRGWRGHFTLKRGHEVRAGGPYLLETTDGRCGQIMVDASDAGSAREAEVTFTGTGPFGQSEYQG